MLLRNFEKLGHVGIMLVEQEGMNYCLLLTMATGGGGVFWSRYMEGVLDNIIICPL